MTPRAKKVSAWSAGSTIVLVAIAWLLAPSLAYLLCLLPGADGRFLCQINMDIDHAQGELILRLAASEREDPAALDALAALLRQEGARLVLPALDRDRSYRVILEKPGEKALYKLAEKLDRQAGVQSVEANVLLSLDQVAEPSNRALGDAWPLDRIGVRSAWESSRGSRAVKVAVIDDGVAYTHRDLADNIWVNPCEDLNRDGLIEDDERNGVDDACPDGSGSNEFPDDFVGWDFVDDDADPTPDPAALHGTLIAGLIGAVENDTGIVGVSPIVSIVAIKVVRDQNLRQDQAIRAIEYATRIGVDVINASWSVSARVPKLLPWRKPLVPRSFPSLEAAINAAGAAGIAVVAAAGNSKADNDRMASIPATLNCENIISVAATDAQDKLWKGSNFGLLSVDLAAPGTDVRSTVPCSAVTTAAAGCAATELLPGGGTSIAAPFVTATAALLRAHFPGISVSDLKQRIVGSGDCVKGLVGLTVSGRRLNVGEALKSPVQRDPCKP